MRLIKLPTIIRMVIEPTTNLKEAFKIYNPKKHFLNLEGKFNNEEFLKDFASIFNKIEQLSLSNSGLASNDFVYSLSKLKILSIGFYTDVDTIIDMGKVNMLETLSISWYPKKIKNLSHQTKVKDLNLTRYKEKDLTTLKCFENILELSMLGGSLKSLKGIESFNNLEILKLTDLRSLDNISHISSLNNIKKINFDSLYKLSDFSPLGEIEKLEDLEIIDCKKLASIKFVKNLSNLNRLVTLGTTIINDFDTTPAKDVPIFFGSRASSKYNVEYPEKEILN
ncbi:hypothetical protein A8C32_00505 [Flavivirga aquatica]|uniref:Internalin n=1 Tax=Flavivirga aquatica TaxID=1849968 RepID=A0A1E5TBM5_9FLAO|nr:hypothetical protein [Flavivirga aquatica]OEK08793.1 hypothetical protein A8C32_00505 [Flavivirga aquatica]